MKQFLNGRREGPIGMSEEKDASQVAAELASIDPNAAPAPGTGPKGSVGGGVPPQIQPSPGLPERQAGQAPPGAGVGDAAHPAAARAEGHHRPDGPRRPRRSRSPTSQPEGPGRRRTERVTAAAAGLRVAVASSVARGRARFAGGVGRVLARVGARLALREFVVDRRRPRPRGSARRGWAGTCAASDSSAARCGTRSGPIRTTPAAGDSDATDG